MKIHNVRLGLATNSSSTHSILVLPTGQKLEDNDVGGSFGWDFFTAASREQKMRYLSVLLFDAMRKVSGPDVAHSITKDWMGVDYITPNLTETDEFSQPFGYIDHQSHITLPLAMDGKAVSKPFFDAMKRYLARPDVVILGGNDNDEAAHPDSYAGKTLRLTASAIPVEETPSRVRFDPQFGFWTLFNDESGTKVRMSFAGDMPESVPVEKSSTPELVDIKITDYCPFGCAFCYQSSTKNGKHAETSKIWGIASRLSELDVFEVALGGGEPTLHPDFLQILKAFRGKGIVPNFTTKSLGWLTAHPEALETCGAFAYSVQTAEEVRALSLALPKTYINKASVQYVMGINNNLESILREAHEHSFRVTLLGFKDFGFGKTTKALDYSKWFEILLKLHGEGAYPRVGIDTSLAAESLEALKAAGVPAWCYSLEEGKFSMYIDAVAQQMGPSSYCAKDLMKPLNAYAEQGAIRDAFAQW